MKHISQINELIGPLFGPHMLKLITVMREEHNYPASAVPSEMARAALRYIPSDVAAPSMDMCPELFAAHALQAMGHSIDQDEAAKESAEFQKRLRFHGTG